MALTVNSNIQALNAYRNLNKTQSALSSSLEKLSSGLRINRASDDAAGLALSQGLKAQVGGLTQAVRNAQDGTSVVQTAEGALSAVQTILQRLRTLAVQGANDSNDANARQAIKTESDSLVAEIDRIAKSTEFNGTKLLDGSTSSLKFQVGSAANANSQITVALTNVNSTVTALNGGAAAGVSFTFASGGNVASLTTAAQTFKVANTTAPIITTTIVTGTLADTADGSAAGFQSVDEYAAALRADAAFSSAFTVSVLRDGNGGGNSIVVSALNGGTVDTTTPLAAAFGAGVATSAGSAGLGYTSAAAAQGSLTAIDTQIKAISTARASLGAASNRLNYAVDNLNVSIENLTASQSRVEDTDMASEMVQFTRAQILSQAGTSMLAQAKSLPSSVLDLLKG